ncbi:hypothetical protein NS220_05920 [Microbacterium testaceum]|uniref:WxL domain-containing protein n=1 Tax=Microbacterium testaceum TaxID=2033 RepID=A0A147EYP7_MICTE|nr:hypothetical protein [Microbacterium testaceum]KTR95438.1 hypothetical protein NS220_05920 [Microbacterium testaceum]
MKFSHGFAARVAVATAGGLILAGTAGAAFAAEQPYGDSDVDVNVNIAPVDGPGTLSLTVAGTSTSLTENKETGDPSLRQFDGSLPQVTVTDTRDPASVSTDLAWYVLGQASDFTGSAGTISAGNLGWTPKVLDPADGLVAEGPQVDTVEDADPDGFGNNVGLKDKELLYLTTNSSDLLQAGGKSWSASADLVLKTGTDVAPGSYSSTLTLSLFEDVVN